MGMVTVRDLAESPRVSEVIVADVSQERMREVKVWVKSKKLSTKLVDASDHKSLVEAMKEVDAVANATPYHLNLKVTKAAIEAGKNMTDLGGVYHMTRKQLRLDRAAREAGVTIVLGCGLAPGIADILAKYGADRMERVEEVHVRYGEKNLEPVKYKWAFRTVLEEYTAGAVVYKNGKFRRLPPFSGKQTVKFPEPLGECSCCYGLYSGVATLPFTIGKGVNIVDCVMAYREEDEQRNRVLKEMGLTDMKPVQVGRLTITPREFLLHCVPPPDVRVKDVAGVVVEVSGEVGGEKVKYIYSVVQSYNQRYGVSAIAYLTGVPLSIAGQMLAQEDIQQKGVLPSEVAVKPKSFITELSKRGIKILETIERTRTL